MALGEAVIRGTEAWYRTHSWTKHGAAYPPPCEEYQLGVWSSSMTKEQFKAQLKQTVNEYIKTVLANEEVNDISMASRAVVDNKILSLVDTVELAIKQVTNEPGSSGSNYYWEDGRFFSDHSHPSVPSNAVAITESLWNDWYSQKEHLKEDDITEQMQGQILIRKQKFSTSDGRLMYCVAHIVTTETPNRMKLFYFIPA